MKQARCVRPGCEKRYPIEDIMSMSFSLPSLSLLLLHSALRLTLEQGSADVKRCNICGTPIKPDIIFFGQSLRGAEVVKARTVCGREGGNINVVRVVELFSSCNTSHSSFILFFPLFSLETNATVSW